MNHYEQLDAWVDANFQEETQFLQALIQVPTDTPPGNNTPHAQRTAQLLEAMGLVTEQHEVPKQLVQDAGLESVTNLIVRRQYGEGKIIALNAHGVDQITIFSRHNFVAGNDDAGPITLVLQSVHLGQTLFLFGQATKASL